MQSVHTITTHIWQELPADNPAQTQTARCHGYDVYGQMLGRCTMTQMLYLMVMGELPTPEQLKLLDSLAVALANPGPREQSVHAAMSAGVSRSPMASWLMSALAVAEGRYGGSYDVQECMQRWTELGPDLLAWQVAMGPREAENIWPACSYPAGFAAAGPLTGPLVRQTLEQLTAVAANPTGPLAWVLAHFDELEMAAKAEVAFSLVAATTFAELGMTPQQGAMLHLLLRLPGAAVHALEQSQLGHRGFPFPPAEKLPVPTHSQTSEDAQ
jgi:citrate synthase